MTPEEIRDTLDAAIAETSFVTIRRSVEDIKLYGYPMGRSDDWLLIHFINADMFALDGYRVIRLRDIESVRDDDTFTARALKWAGVSPRPLPWINLGSVPELIRSVNADFSLFTIYLEIRWPDTCYIGKLASMTQKSLMLWEIDPKAEWRDEKPRRYFFQTITQVQFGDRYGVMLWQFGKDEWQTRFGNTNSGGFPIE